LVFAFPFQHTTHKEVELILEIISNQGSLTDTPTTIQGYEFTFATTLIAPELGKLTVSSYYFIHVMNFSAKLDNYFQSVAKVCDF
jgi:hypothetical protein